MPRRVRIVHETNPKKYFPALFGLAANAQITLAGAHRYSVFKEWLRAGLKDRTPLGTRSLNAWSDLRFRVSSIFLRGETIVLGFAPWDWRILLYGRLARHNTVLYHTSWHDWGRDKTPRQPRLGFMKSLLMRKWRAFLRQDNVSVVAVTPLVADAVGRFADVPVQVIPHAVPDVFYKHGAQRDTENRSTLKLLYVGEVSAKKGIPQMLSIMQDLTGQNVTLTIVGAGPLSDELRQNSQPNVSYDGPVYDREKLAQIMSAHDVLLLLSQRTETWEELFGIVVIEALASGLAVVASNHVGPQGILDPVGGPGLFDEAATAQVRDYLATLAQDRSQLDALYSQQSGVKNAYMLDDISKNWLAAIDAAQNR